MAQESLSNWAFLNIEEDIAQKMDFTDITDLFTAAKTSKRLY